MSQRLCTTAQRRKLTCKPIDNKFKSNSKLSSLRFLAPVCRAWLSRGCKSDRSAHHIDTFGSVVTVPRFWNGLATRRAGGWVRTGPLQQQHDVVVSGLPNPPAGRLRHRPSCCRSNVWRIGDFVWHLRQSLRFANICEFRIPIRNQKLWIRIRSQKLDSQKFYEFESESQIDKRPAEQAF